MGAPLLASDYAVAQSQLPKGGRPSFTEHAARVSIAERRAV